jgi:hypothetical protein
MIRDIITIGYAIKVTLVPCPLLRGKFPFALVDVGRHCSVFFRVNTLVKNRHTREGGYPFTIQLLEKNGFPIKYFGNDGLGKDLLHPSPWERLIRLRCQLQYCP